MRNLLIFCKILHFFAIFLRKPLDKWILVVYYGRREELLFYLRGVFTIHGKIREIQT